MENKTLFEQAISSILNKIDSTEKFIVDQAPEVCKQLLAERAITERMDLGLNLVLCPALTWASVHMFDIIHAEGFHGDSFGYAIAGGLLAFGAFISFLFAYCTVQRLVSLKVAPKVYLLRELASIVSRSSKKEE